MNRLSSIKINNIKHLNNRIVTPAMASQTADLNGTIRNSTLRHYKRLEQAHSGLLIVEYSYVHRSGRSEPNQLAADATQDKSRLSELARILKVSGNLAGLQIVHGGGKSERSLTDGLLLGPSPVSVPDRNRKLEVMDTIKIEEIPQYQKWYVDAAERAYTSGFDLVELHAAHGYGLNQWISPITNIRKDIYGGSNENRFRILFEIVEMIRNSLPDLLLSVRIPGQDFFDQGLKIADAGMLANGLAARGVHIVSVSSGLGGWRRPRERIGEGYLVDEAESIQKLVEIPVIGVGGIKSAHYIDKVIRGKKVDLVAVGRAILKDPLAWNKKILTLKSVVAC